MLLSPLALAGRFTTMTSYFSLAFLGVFLPVCIIIYCFFPQKWKKYFLLFASYSFFWLISGKLLIYLVISTTSIYLFSLLIGKLEKNKCLEVKNISDKEEKKAIKKIFKSKQLAAVTICIVINLGILLTLKYLAFFTFNINSILHFFHSDLQFAIPRYIMPIGISFFTMQAISYVFDVYRGTVPAEKNYFKLALFMSFFPQIIEGPICRYSQTADQLWSVKAIKFSDFCAGAERILFGFMKKLVIADRLNPLINNVFSNPGSFDGSTIALAAVAYTVQLYMDFSGTMDAVIGTAQIFGVKMPENFSRPFFSKNISEFWKRWHISLGTWFKDYIFYPLTLSKPMKNLTARSRKKLGNHFGPLIAGGITLLIVWICNGLWHGPAWNYIFFGLYHFSFILLGNLINPLVLKVNKKLHINADSWLYKFLQIIRTAVLVIIGELFFRSAGLKNGFSMFMNMLTNFHFMPLTPRLMRKLGVDYHDLVIVAVALVIIFIISILKEKGINIREKVNRSHIVISWGLIYALIVFIIIFGAYGKGYIPVDPIYANF